MSAGQPDQDRGAMGERVLGEVRDMIVEVIGEDYVLDMEITTETAFEGDLELESVEFVALAERLSEFYGEEVDFVAWLADKELDDIIALTVGDLVDFITGSLDA